MSQFSIIARSAFGGFLLLGGGLALAEDNNSLFNKPGNILIADQFNNRAIEIDPATHGVVWVFGSGSSVAGPRSTVGVNDVERVGVLTLLTGTGIPAGIFCPSAGGCPDNRVMLVDKTGIIVWQYGQAGVAGSGADLLNVPVAAVFLPGFHVLITDQSNQRVIEVDHGKNIVWQFGVTGVTGKSANHLNTPNSAELLANGHILISDQGNNRVIEVGRDHKIVATFTAGASLSGPAFASRLDSGNTLITDANNNRIVEVDSGDNIVWQYFTNLRPGSIPNPVPTRAVRLASGNTLISDQINNQVIEVNPAKVIVFAQGKVNVAGNGFDQLYWPYDAKVVGDYTGLTPP